MARHPERPRLLASEPGTARVDVKSLRTPVKMAGFCDVKHESKTSSTFVCVCV